MKLLTDTPDSELRGKRVLLRAGLDVPIQNGVIMDSFRITRAVPSIEYLRARGARVIILSHIGRDGESLISVAEALSSQMSITFVSSLTDDAARTAVKSMQDGDVIMLENVRKDAGEEGNSPDFAHSLADMGDIYVNDAFSVAHREHASVVLLPKLLPHYAGIDFASEVDELSSALTPPSPSLCILGGAKFETKEPLIEHLLQRHSHVFVCGALANDIFRARGLEVGTSRVSERLPKQEVVEHPNLLLPIDVVVKRADGSVAEVAPEQVAAGDAIKDMGQQTLAMLAPFVNDAQMIIWNGPTGLYEEGFVEISAALGKAVTASDARTIIGGGDTVAVLEQAGVLSQFSFISTGGGAMLQFLLEGTLPGIEALE